MSTESESRDLFTSMHMDAAALSAAMNSGLIRQNADGVWETEAFDRFMGLFSSEVKDYGERMKEEGAKDSDSDSLRYPHRCVNRLLPVFGGFLGYFIAAALFKFLM